VSYNSFINCTGPARWVGSNGTCDGGATEISAASGGTIQNVSVHHNFSYNSCGFLEIGTYFGDQGKGLFKDSSFHHNVIIDSAWMGLLQVNNTDLENIHFYNNTLIHCPGSPNAGILWIIFTATSSGMEGGQLVPGTVHLTNNLYVLDGVKSYSQLINPAFVTNSNIVASYSGPQDPAYVDFHFANIAGKTAADFDLASADSPAVDAGVDIAGSMLDFFNRARPFGRTTDIGAMEFGSAQLECLPRFPITSTQPLSILAQSFLVSPPPAENIQPPLDLSQKRIKNPFKTALTAPGFSPFETDSFGRRNAARDSDGDGVSNGVDQCSNSILQPTVVIDNCDSGVMNPLSPAGCTLSDDIQSLANSSMNHRQLAERVTPYPNKLLREEALTKSQKDAIQNCVTTPAESPTARFVPDSQ
jgi:hypothetical protein